MSTIGGHYTKYYKEGFKTKKEYVDFIKKMLKQAKYDKNTAEYKIEWYKGILKRLEVKYVTT